MRDSQRKGDIAVTQAISTFTRLGWDVSIPITESAKYDLVVDIEGIIKRVQVKYMGSDRVDLRNIHSNGRGYVIKKAGDNDYDWLYIYRIDGREYLIKECLVGRNSIAPQTIQLLGSN